MKKYLAILSLLAQSVFAADMEFIDTTVGAGHSGKEGGDIINRNFSNLFAGKITLTNPVVSGTLHGNISGGTNLAANSITGTFNNVTVATNMSAGWNGLISGNAGGVSNVNLSSATGAISAATYNKQMDRSLAGRPALGWPLDAATPDGLPQIVHPNALAFETNWPNVNGYKYWLIYDIYPPDTRELPCVVASHNGLDWGAPAGGENPIYTPAGFPNPHTADTELVYVASSNALAAFFLVGSDALYRSYSTDGVTWTTASCLALTNNIFACPSVVYDQDSKLTMWIWEYDTGSMVRYESADAGANWTWEGVCTNVNTAIVPAFTNWHHDVVLVGTNYHAALCASRASGAAIDYGYSANGWGWTIRTNAVLQVGRYGYGFYKASMVPVSEQPLRFDIYAATYSGYYSDSNSPGWRLVYMPNVNLSGNVDYENVAQLEARIARVGWLTGTNGQPVVHSGRSEFHGGTYTNVVRIIGTGGSGSSAYYRGAQLLIRNTNSVVGTYGFYNDTFLALQAGYTAFPAAEYITYRDESANDKWMVGRTATNQFEIAYLASPATINPLIWLDGTNAHYNTYNTGRVHFGYHPYKANATYGGAWFFDGGNSGIAIASFEANRAAIYTNLICTSPVFIRSNLYPAAPKYAGDVGMWNSNGHLYLLSTTNWDGTCGSAWTHTNLLGPN